MFAFGFNVMYDFVDKCKIRAYNLTKSNIRRSKVTGPIMMVG